MTLRDSTHLLRKLNPYCASALADAASLCNARLHGEITPEHWLLKLIKRGDGDTPALLLHYEIDVDTVWDALLASLERLPRELRGKPALSRPLAEVLQGAWLHASAAGDGASDETAKLTSIRSSHLLRALVEAPHCLRTRDAWPLLSISAAQIHRLASVIDRYSVEANLDMTGETTESASSMRGELRT
jgi:type VI secretion system protein VasG